MQEELVAVVCTSSQGSHPHWGWNPDTYVASTTMGPSTSLMAPLPSHTHPITSGARTSTATVLRVNDISNGLRRASSKCSRNECCTGASQHPPNAAAPSRWSPYSHLRPDSQSQHNWGSTSHNIQHATPGIMHGIRSTALTLNALVTFIGHRHRDVMPAVQRLTHTQPPRRPSSKQRCPHYGKGMGRPTDLHRRTGGAASAFLFFLPHSPSTCVLWDMRRRRLGTCSIRTPRGFGHDPRKI